MMDLDINVSHPYQCDKCEYSCPYERSLTQHMWRVHPAVRESSRRQKSRKLPYSPLGVSPQSIPKKIPDHYHQSIRYTKHGQIGIQHGQKVEIEE